MTKFFYSIVLIVSIIFIIPAYSSAESLSNLPVYEYYTSLEKSTQSSIMKDISNKSYSNTDDITQAFNEAVILNSFNNAESNEKAYEILRSNNDTLKINFYLSDELNIKVCKKIRIYKYDNIQDLALDFEREAENMRGCGGGGGGGSLITEPIVTSEICGESLSWNLADGILTISGTGKMLDFSKVLLPPWDSSDEAITGIIIENGVESIGSYAFSGCYEAINIQIPNSVQSIGAYAFSNCFSLEKINIPRNVTIIGDYAFRNCTLIESFIIPDSVTTLGKYAFEGCTRLKKITIPAGIKQIGIYTFSHCSNLKEVTICNSKISPFAFNGCIRIENVILTENISEIGVNAFEDCLKISSINYTGNSDKWNLVTIADFNNPLINAETTYNYRIYISETSVSRTPDYDIFALTPSNVPIGSSLLFVCYKNGQTVHLESRIYNGENPVYFVEYNGIDYDNVKIFIWSGLNSLVPLGEVTDIKIQNIS